MNKRVAAGVLWFFAAWYAWNIIAMIVGLSDAPGPVFGLLAALLLAGDPLRQIWTKPTSEPSNQASAPPVREIA